MACSLSSIASHVPMPASLPSRFCILCLFALAILQGSLYAGINTGASVPASAASLAGAFAIVPAVAQTGWQNIGDLSSYEKRVDGLEVKAQRGQVRLTVLSPTVIRVSYKLQNEEPARTSFAVLPDAFQGDTKLQIGDSANDLSLNTGSLIVRIYKSPLRIAFLTATGDVISEDQPTAPPAFNGSTFKVWKAMPEDEHYFGLGDKSGSHGPSQSGIHDVEYRHFWMAGIHRSSL